MLRCRSFSRSPGFYRMSSMQVSSSSVFRRKKGPITDILLWVQCFASLASVLASAYPSKTQELMAYLATIVRYHREFESPSWVIYDRAFRRHAEATQDLNWSKVNAWKILGTYGALLGVS